MLDNQEVKNIIVTVMGIELSSNSDKFDEYLYYDFRRKKYEDQDVVFYYKKLAESQRYLFDLDDYEIGRY